MMTLPRACCHKAPNASFHAPAAISGARQDRFGQDFVGDLTPGASSAAKSPANAFCRCQADLPKQPKTFVL
eukprot:9680719-Alexandrium_andersonii.AAC.1